MTTPTVASIRASLGEGNDRESICHLARLSEAEPPQGAVVLAEIRGTPVAAVGIADGRAVSDPARSTPALLRHLRLHSVQVRVIGSIRAI
ncbi:MAG TPA: hypothetical protein VIY10_22560 [Solirubrobacteraceae bacterium]|jgi:hypothetical protein